MNKIVWDDAYSVGVAELDGHHRRLAELINALGDHPPHAGNQLVVEKAIANLTTYAFYHFGREEQLMIQCGFPALATHLTEHEQFCDTMKRIRQHAAMGNVDLSQLTDFLANWWAHHILEVDMQYKPFLAASSKAEADAE